MTGEIITRAPKQISGPILELARHLVPGESLTFLDIRPREDGIPNECFGTVERQVHDAGGSVQHGWAIWEWPNVMVEAEFHAVWRAPNGSLIDVTPRTDTETHILFLPDPNRKFEGNSIDNVRMPLRNDPRIHEFIKLAKQKYEILNRGDRATQFGVVAVPCEEIEPVLRRFLQLKSELAKVLAGRNDPCPCGSGKKYKRCHGKS